MIANPRRALPDLHQTTGDVLCTMHDIKIRAPTQSRTSYNVILVLLGRQPSHVATICTAQHENRLIVILTSQSIHAFNAWTHKFFVEACVLQEKLPLEGKTICDIECAILKVTKRIAKQALRRYFGLLSTNWKRLIDCIVSSEMLTCERRIKCEIYAFIMRMRRNSMRCWNLFWWVMMSCLMKVKMHTGLICAYNLEHVSFSRIPALVSMMHHTWQKTKCDGYHATSHIRSPIIQVVQQCFPIGI